MDTFIDTFSDELQAYIDNAGLKIQTLSKLTMIERTRLHKIISGDRMPDEEMLEKIISVLMLTPEQSSRLRKLYAIRKMGGSIYSRHMLVKNMIENMGNLPARNSNINFSFYHSMGDQTSCTLYGTNEIQSTLKAIVEMEAAKPSGKIMIIAQPDFSFLLDMLTILGQHKPDLCVEHIICLQQSVGEKDDNHHNISCLSAISPLLSSLLKYNPLVYYDHVKSHINSTSILPYIIMTEDCVLNISYDIKHALFFRSGPFMEFYASIYKNIYAISKPMFNRLGSALEYLGHYENTSAFSCNATLFPEPCIGFFITRNKQMLNKYCLPDFPGRLEIINIYSGLMEKRYQKYSEYNNIIESYFTVEGLDKFISTGRVSELPDDYYIPIEKIDRYRLLQEMYTLSKKGLFYPAIINTLNFKVPENIVVASALVPLSASIVCIHPQFGPMAFDLNEQSLVFSIANFLEYLKKSDMVLSVEKTLEIIEDRLEKLKNEIGR